MKLAISGHRNTESLEMHNMSVAILVEDAAEDTAGQATDEKLVTATQSLKCNFDRFLARHDVIWPGGQELTGLVYLYLRIGQIVSKEDLTVYVRSRHPGAGDYQSGRHLADKGWDVRSTNPRFSRGILISKDENPAGIHGYKLGSVEHPNPIWATKSKIKRRGVLAAESWQELLFVYKERGRAVCGVPADHYDKGHLDSSGPPKIPNIVPMCVECNLWAAAHNFNFELKGMVARPYPQKAASSNVTAR